MDYGCCTNKAKDILQMQSGAPTSRVSTIEIAAKGSRRLSTTKQPNILDKHF